VKSVILACLWAAVGLLAPAAACAEATAQPMPMESRVVVYAYEPNNTYTVLTRPGAN